jgi:acyl carrier protein
MKSLDSLENELKLLIVTTLRLEDIRPQDIDSDQPLFNEGLGLDSIDGLELGIAISKTYKIELSHDPEENKHYFANVRNLSSFICQQMIEKEG